MEKIINQMFCSCWGKGLTAIKNKQKTKARFFIAVCTVLAKVGK